MEQIKKKFQELNSADQTTLLCELIEQNGGFIDYEKIINIIIENIGVKKTNDIVEMIEEDLYY